MSRVTGFLVLISIALAIVGVAALVGCGEKDVPVIVDADELIRYVNETYEARDLFRTSGLINSDPYTVSFDSAVFHDSLVSHTRGIETFLVPLDRPLDEVYADYGGYIGRVRESVVRVEDRFTIQISRVYSDTTLFDTTQFFLDRYGFFLKLGDDSKPYVGWTLWGFNGIGTVAPPLGVTLESSSGAQFRGDLGLYPDLPLSHSSAIPRVSYIRLTAMDTVLQGSRLLVTASKASSGRPTFQLVSDYDSDGAFTRAMHRYDTVNIIDSLSYQTVSGNPRLYNLVFIQVLTDQSYPIRSGFVVPYRW